VAALHDPTLVTHGRCGPGYAAAATGDAEGEP
jgi:hypothetical protein